MNRRIIILFMMALIFFIPFCGCQLAVENSGADELNGRLIGAFITTEYLDLFDMERYIQDNIGQFANGGNIYVEKNNLYEGRIYATQTSKTITDGDGHSYQDIQYDFDGIKGFSFFAPKLTDSHGNNVTTMVSDATLYAGQLMMGDDTRLEATVYIQPSDSFISFFVNPVYQKEDGTVYLMAGTGISSGGNTAGGSMAQEISEKYETTANGESSSESVAVKVHFTIRDLPEQIVILHMAESGELLSREVYSENSLPDAVEAANGAVYWIIETFSSDTDGQQTVSREIINDKEKGIETFTIGKNGTLIPKFIKIIQKQESGHS